MVGSLPLETFLNAAPDAMIVVDPGGIITVINRQAEALFGYEPHELVGQSIEVLVPERLRAGHPSHRAGYFASPRTRPMASLGATLFARRKDGSEFPAEISLSPLADGRGAPAIAAIRDITERRRAAESMRRAKAELDEVNRELDAFSDSVASDLRAPHEALARSEKLQALGQMAAGISHDLRNMLNPLSLHLQFLRRALARGDSTEASESVKEMEQLVRRGVETLERLRAFSRKEPDAPPTVVDVNVAVREAVEIALPRPSFAQGELRPIAEELGSPPPILARAADLIAALVNLLVNAIDAVREGGSIMVRTRAEAEGALVEVSDTGPGMPEDVAPRVFEPFFTTKGAEGTGLGLAMVEATVKACGGTIALRTAPGDGTTFTLWFPKAAGDSLR